MRYVINVWANRLREVKASGYVLFARKWGGDWYFRLENRVFGVRADSDFFRMVSWRSDWLPTDGVPVVYLDSPYTHMDGGVEQEVRPSVPTEEVKSELIAELMSSGHTAFTFWEGE